MPRKYKKPENVGGEFHLPYSSLNFERDFAWIKLFEAIATLETHFIETLLDKPYSCYRKLSDGLMLLHFNCFMHGQHESLLAHPADGLTDFKETLSEWEEQFPLKLLLPNILHLAISVLLHRRLGEFSNELAQNVGIAPQALGEASAQMYAIRSHTFTTWRHDDSLLNKFKLQLGDFAISDVRYAKNFVGMVGLFANFEKIYEHLGTPMPIISEATAEHLAASESLLSKTKKFHPRYDPIVETRGEAKARFMTELEKQVDNYLNQVDSQIKEDAAPVRAGSKPSLVDHLEWFYLSDCKGKNQKQIADEFGDGNLGDSAIGSGIKKARIVLGISQKQS